MTKTLTAGGAVVRSEPMTYAEHGAHSWIIDVASQGADGKARARLQRHAREFEVETRARRAAGDREFRTRLAALDGRAEVRANPSNLLGSGGEFDPPMWLIDRFSSSPRPGRVLSDLIDRAGNLIPLPAGVSSINVPRIVTGSLTAVQAAPGGVVASQDMTSAPASANVVTIAGQADVAVQLRDLTPGLFDRVAFADLTRDYDQRLEVQLITGTGAGGQLLGLTNVSGVSTVTFTSGAPTLTLLWPILGQAAAALVNARQMPPTAALLTGYRSFWVMSSLDSSNRPVASPATAVPRDPGPLAGGSWASWSILGVPVYMDQALPSTVGTGANQDQILFIRPEDFLLFESAPKVFVAPSPLSGTLQVRLSLHRYAAAVLHRLPSAVSVITGTGLTRPAGF